MKKISRTSWLNMPYVFWAAAFVIVPLVIVAYYAFTDSSGSFTLENIKALSSYAGTIRISLEYSLIATVICLVIAYPFAWLISRFSENSQRVMTMLVMLPMWMNLLIRTYSWMNILEQNGIINNLLTKLGLEPVQFLGTPAAVIFGMIYNYLPYMIIPIYNVLSKLDKSLIDAASDLGANAFNRLTRVLIPLSMPGIISGIAMVFVPSVSTFYISQKLGSGKILLIGDTIERYIKTSYNYNMGASLSLILMLIILASMMVMNKTTNDDEELIV